jgi:hypothetical protein
VVGVDDLARLVLQSAYERILYGAAEVTPRDAAALLRVAREYQHDTAVAQAEQAQARADTLDTCLSALVWSARKHMDAAQWRGFADDLRRECEPLVTKSRTAGARRPAAPR